jgi:hypothetical protein
MDKAMSRESYQELVEDVRACVRACVPPGAVVLIASKGDEDLVQIDGLRAWHFPRDEWGSYAGHHPASSVEAIVHLRHLFAQGARYLVFPATAAWWLEHYRELADLLDSAHELKMSHDGVCVVYELHESAAFDAFAAMDPGVASWDGGDDKAGAPTQLLTLAPPASRPSLRVLTILARFGSEQYAGAEVEIADLFMQQLRPVERRVIVVDNALPREFVEQRHDGSVLIGGDNSSREFSAFDRALDWLGADVWSYDFVHLATSAFNTLYVAYLERFGPSLLAAAAGRPACIGHIDCYNEPIRVRTYHAQHWIRSCFFFLPPTELQALGSLVSIADGRSFFSGDPDSPFRADAPLDQQYRDYIMKWLTGAGVGQGVTWHSTFALTPDTIDAFEQKARAILNEQLLSIRLQALGCRLVDVTWLSAMLRVHQPREVPWSVSWREQLANRDRDALILAPAQREARVAGRAPSPHPAGAARAEGLAV